MLTLNLKKIRGRFSGPTTTTPKPLASLVTMAYSVIRCNRLIFVHKTLKPTLSNIKALYYKLLRSRNNVL